jgi:hypothetical protein
MKDTKNSGFLSVNGRQQLNQFPETIDQNNLIQHFLLSELDREVIPEGSPAYSKVGFSLSLCALRFLGFIPEDRVGLLLADTCPYGAQYNNVIIVFLDTFYSSCHYLI